MPKRSLQPLLLTLALCALPWIATSHPQGWLVSNAAFAGFIKPLPFLIFAVLAFLGVKLNQSRLLYVSVFLAAAYLYLQVPHPPAFVAFRPWSRIQAVGLCAPISLALIFLLPEGRLLSRRSIVSGVAALGPLVFVAAGLLHRWPWLEKLMAWQGVSHGGSLKLPEAVALIASAFGLAAFLHQNPARRLLHVFLGVSLVPLFAAINYRSVLFPGPNIDVITAIAFACQSGLLVYGVFLLYWERVYLDELTGIPNRRALNEMLPRLGKVYAIAMVDIDHFKRFNDTYGHEEGDNVLRFVAAHLDQATTGRAYRYGGEEFTVVFDQDSIEKAAEVMESARRTLADRAFTIRAPRGKKTSNEEKLKRARGEQSRSQIRLTFSVGLADSQPSDSTPETVIQAADQALYHAKDGGRNCLVLAGDVPTKRRRAKHT